MDQPKALVVRDDPDWIDLQFWILRHEIIEDGAWVMIGVGARHGERRPTFWLVYPLAWEASPGTGGPYGLAAPIQVLRANPHGDDFLHVLAELWRVEAPTSMAPRTELWAISYDGHPEGVMTHSVNVLAVVGEPPQPGQPADPTKPYGQVHLIVDIPAGTVKLCEREPDLPEFRHAIVHAFARGS